ncbi:MAG: RNA polymerase sigma factor [Acidimicrobiia bacterium]|nr:RNA polymerase sigma factor [Acidimicrobiia bacterium]
MTRDEEMYRKHSEELTRFATGLVGPHNAPDVVTDACLRVFRSPTWKTVDNPRAYLYQSVLNESRSHHRSALRRQVKETEAARLAGATSSVATMRTLDVDVLRALDRLSLRQRAVLFLTYWEDLDPGEVGRTLDISTGSVKRHLARGRAKLRELLDA